MMALYWVLILRGLGGLYYKGGDLKDSMSSPKPQTLNPQGDLGFRACGLGSLGMYGAGLPGFTCTPR